MINVSIRQEGSEGGAEILIPGAGNGNDLAGVELCFVPEMGFDKFQVYQISLMGNDKLPPGQGLHQFVDAGGNQKLLIGTDDLCFPAQTLAVDDALDPNQGSFTTGGQGNGFLPALIAAEKQLQSRGDSPAYSDFRMKYRG